MATVKPALPTLRPPAMVAPAKPKPPKAPSKLNLPTDIPAPDPFEGKDYSDDLEQASAEQLSDLSAGFRDRLKAEQVRRASTTAADYFVCLVFQTGDQVTAFLKATRDKGAAAFAGELFIDGLELAAALNIDIPEAPALPSGRKVPTNISAKIDPKLAALVKPMSKR